MLTQQEILDYEVKSSWWAPNCYGDFLQTIAALYFAWKVRRKYRRYKARIARGELLRHLRAYEEKETTAAKHERISPSRDSR